jgi:GNAT superfamily N-acetyltransferase
LPVPSVLELELAAFDAWPAEEVEELDGWRLRAMAGVTHRANSVWTAVTSGERGLAERIASVEAFYAARGLPSQFMLSPLSPQGLDVELEARGYRMAAPVAIQLASAEGVAALASSHTARVTAEPSPEFLELMVERGRFRSAKEHFLRLLSRLGGSGRYAAVSVDGAVAGAGFGVFSGSVFGLFGMLTLPEFRRRGVARAVAVNLARGPASGGADWIYLQVERDNPEALGLYAQLGFREVYGYHYRVGDRARTTE